MEWERRPDEAREVLAGLSEAVRTATAEGRALPKPEKLNVLLHFAGLLRAADRIEPSETLLEIYLIFQPPTPERKAAELERLRVEIRERFDQPFGPGRVEKAPPPKPVAE